MNSDFFDSYAPIEGEVVTDEPWPMPTCPYCASDNEAVRATFCNATCAGCLSRHFDNQPPEPPTLWERFCRWAKGVQHD